MLKYDLTLGDELDKFCYQTPFLTLDTSGRRLKGTAGPQDRLEEASTAAWFKMPMKF